MSNLRLMKRPLRPAERGFALIVTIALMVLLTLLAVGLLSLSTITTRGSSKLSGLAEARANARLAMLMAIGQLQKEFGPDQRISASASILGTPGAEDEDVVNAHWVGAWDAWTGENRYLADKHSPDDLVPDLSEHRGDSFRSWLVSPRDPGALRELGSARAETEEDALRLVGAGTLGEQARDGREVRAPRVRIEAGDSDRPRIGALAWWVGDESQKGLIRAGRSRESLSDPVEVLAETDSPSSIAEELYPVFEGPSDEGELARAAISRRTLDFLSNASELGSLYHDLTVNAHSVLADVREGGLKRDLNLLAEHYGADFEASDGLPLSEEFMMYDFGDLQRVPLHDLLTYYSLYKARPAGSRGALVSGGSSKPYVPNISEGEWSSNKDALTTNLYRQPVLVKTQLAVWARADRSSGKPNRPYRLKIRFTPILTLWNPYNVPLYLNGSAGDAMRIDVKGISADFAVWPNYRTGNDAGRESSSLGGLTAGRGDSDNSSEDLARLVIRERIQFAPGEVRVFSLDRVYGNLTDPRDLRAGYWPISGNEVDYYDIRVSRGGATDGLTFDSDSVTFSPDQVIGVGFAGGTEDASATQLKLSQGVSVEVWPDNPGEETSWRTQALYSRRTTGNSPSGSDATEMNKFNQMVFELGSQLDGEEMPFRSGDGMYVRRPYSIRNLESPEGEMVAVFTYGVAGEQEVLSYSYGNQPRFPSRPFLHSLPTAASPWIQDLGTAALYNLGWAWRIEDGTEASNEIVVDGTRGRFGGGWSAAYGQDRVVQYEIAQRPFHSMAQFTNAALGGWSVARQHPTSNAGGSLNNHEVTTSMGQGGLFPAVSMPIGNSYAHPMIAADEAVSTWNTRKYQGGEHSDPYVDHSYLANHALWDEYFMSSIYDQRLGLHRASGFQGRTAQEMAEGLFGSQADSLPNQRLKPATELPWDEIRPQLFSGSGATDDAYERIARYLLLEGGFNVNSTSVEAWKTLLASLRGKPSLILPAESPGTDFDLEEHDERTPLASFSINTAGSIEADSPLRSDGFAGEQWVGSFTLDDGQIEELAEAIVEQVKKRGPFLSLSDFINRQLSGETELALSGALQAAIEEAGLNDGVNSARTTSFSRRSQFLRDQGERDADPVAFPEAASGPVIQGSTAYIDQADLLRAIDSQLVPRGDTFVIRTCGQSLDAAGTVVATAYCEAIVQRMPEYLDPSDEPELRADELGSAINATFGRRFHLVSFRWLPQEEI